ncbi:carboxypeptidase M32 [sulfur-oxidizing endosymbiont of Gigantopelta aegis]|uniref:carboxypeptidase M32 n=1 Tax=sulfur-oxidizing endosymbiont of Gigantopelta aegis TaxID=2794934 RepID=UPI0018DCD935|nr:carboxypeptidase M32 [sulfur-oxidizing endosymbiont of Gigantopelta aegis]
MSQLPYTQLEHLFNRIYQLQHLASIAHWDMAAMMPAGGSQARGEALAEVSVMMNELLSESRTGDLIHLAQEQQTALSDWQQANLREMHRLWLNATSISSDLVKAKALAGSECEQAWRSLRGENNWQDFQPLLQAVIRLTIEESQQRAAATSLSPYDALLDLYEPGQRSAAIDLIFSELVDFLPDFIQQVVARQADEPLIQIDGSFSIESQRKLGLRLMSEVGFNFDHGRLDVSHHPFCGGVPEDVRITTRYCETDFSESLMGVLHETGHAKYEQGLPKQWLNQPVGAARGMGIHESQSLFQEMQIARSQPFLQFAAPIIQQFLAHEQGDKQCWTAENLFKLNNRVKPDFIRVNADEVTYPLHVILRYEIEKALINETLTVKELPEIWDEKMQHYLGISTAGNDKDGCMQDIHWTDGSLGYFPSYTLGAMNAAQMYAAADKAIPDLSQNIAAGKFTTLNQWQQDKIWSQGSFFDIDGLMVHATGEKLNSQYYIAHLKHRFLPE